MVATCPSDNSADVDQTSFWDSGNLNWDAHRIGWAIAGACTAAVSILPYSVASHNILQTVLISFFSVLGHCRSVISSCATSELMFVPETTQTEASSAKCELSLVYLLTAS
jgi:hypothetical protein